MHIHKWSDWSEPVEEIYTFFLPSTYETRPETFDKEGREETREVQTRKCVKCGEVQRKVVRTL